ncbi:MAG: ribosomal L7Ae/L30e/S12e/Gadd45 family protein [Candidatus Woesearchaeota archaeon]
MAKQDVKKEILQLIQSGKAVVGLKVTLKLLRKAKLKKVMLSTNCPQATKASVTKYCSLANIPCEVLPMTSDELGNACKKPFLISVLSQKE